MLEQLPVLLYSIEREVVVLPLTQTHINLEWSPEIERERAQIEDQMMRAQMESRRLSQSSQYLQFSTHISQTRVCTLDFLRYMLQSYPTMLLELIIVVRV